MASLAKTGGILLIAGGISFVVYVVSGILFSVPLDLPLIIISNIVIVIGNIIAITVYKRLEAKLAALASLFLLITEAAWPLLPIIFLVPVALILMIVQRVQSVDTKRTRIAGLILAIIGVVATIEFVLVGLSLPLNLGSHFISNLGSEGAVTSSWAWFYIGRDVLPGILLILGVMPVSK
ncbi:MAG TPA: hypothetical protein VKM55_02155 [Candidatus Lokiarchaeia archaeon]|nr:hypothetical protein [Candidatus Lokiarchaeia archaeon]